ncbi:MAG: hypothetical protein WC728_09800 [Elusimicrobiota bacterium]
MMWEIDEKKGEVSACLSGRVYTREAMALAARLLARRAEVFEEKGASGKVRITLRPRERKPTREALDALAGDFLCEALNQQCRLDTARHNGNVQKLLVTQALYAARRQAEAAGSQLSPERLKELSAEARKLMQEAAQEG